MYDIYKPLSSGNSLQTADIQVYESMLKIKVPIAESRNEMILKKNIMETLGPKFMIARAILKKYRNIIFHKQELAIKREERKTSQLLTKEDHYTRKITEERPKSEERSSYAHSDFEEHDFIITETRVDDPDEFQGDLENLIDTRRLDVHPKFKATDEEVKKARNQIMLTQTSRRIDKKQMSKVDSLLSNFESQDGHYKQRYLQYENEYAVNYIYLTDINKILVNSTDLIILKENFEVIKLLRDEEKVSDLVALANICQSNAKEVLNKVIEVHKIETLTDQIVHITQHFNMNTKFSSLVYLDQGYFLDGFNNIRKVHLRVDRESIHILKNSSN